MTLVFFQLTFKALEQGEGVGSGAGEARDDLAVVQAAHLLGVAFHHGVAEGYLAVAAHDDFAVTADRNDCGQGESLHAAGRKCLMQTHMGVGGRISTGGDEWSRLAGGYVKAFAGTPAPTGLPHALELW
ncbi:hypothetical protein METHP15_990015 [Pseudomonas sp. P15-2025]